MSYSSSSGLVQLKFTNENTKYNHTSKYDIIYIMPQYVQRYGDKTWKETTVPQISSKIKHFEKRHYT